MCGFAGFIGRHFDVSDPISVLKKMGDTIVHRGPNDNGEWFDNISEIGMTHRRLSILDLSYAGHQPVESQSKRYVIVFNGEIYNHLKLRQELEKNNVLIAWRGHSDTETFLACFDIWGIQTTVQRAVGMFAFAVWDRREKVLILGRDRMGEKPLYYGWQNNIFLFGSELKSFKQHPAFKAVINRDAITLLLRHNYIPAPYSIYQGISKLDPGHLLMVSKGNPEPKIWSYWSAVDIVNNGVNNPFIGSSNEAINQLENLVMKAVKQQMIADVPLGAFLSGGVDSSTIVTLMQNQSSRPIKTFTIGFDEGAYNEAPYAKKVAQHLGTDHTELYVTHKEAMNVIPKLPLLYCEPFSDSSQIPTFLVSHLAKQHVTVSLSGDGGDELFCGYNRYQMTNNLWKKLSIFPPTLRAFFGKAITFISPQDWNNMVKFIPRVRNINNFGDKLHKGAGVMDSRTINELYLRLVSHSRDPCKIVVKGKEPETLLTGNIPDLNQLNGVQRMMALDLMSYLPDDILVKLDRASMGVSLESRVPFLDHRIVEFAWQLPLSMKIQDGQSKWLLRQMLYKYVPKNIIDRPKMGFGVPVDSWLRGPLRDWAESLLDEARLNQEGYFHPSPIRKLWKAHLSGHRNLQYSLWNVLMFQAWLEQESFH